MSRGCIALEKGEWEEAHSLLSKSVEKESLPESYEKLAWACWWMNDAASVFSKPGKSISVIP